MSDNNNHPAAGSLWASFKTGRMVVVDAVFTRRGKWRVKYTREQSKRTNSCPISNFTKTFVKV